ncbi:MAG: hypothetical protein ACPG9R_01160, partial [Marinobacter salsuginis]
MTEREFFVPDLCRVRAVFLLLVTSELLVLVLAIVQAGGVTPLVNMLTAPVPAMQARAAGALANLANHHVENQS